MARTARPDQQDPWASLPRDECRSVWEETERNFWPKFRRERDQELAEAGDSYRKHNVELSLELAALSERQRHLRSIQERLARELADTEHEVAAVRDACDAKAGRMTEFEKRYRTECQDMLKRRHNMAIDMTNWFRQQRGDEPLSAAEVDMGYGENPMGVEETSSPHNGVNDHHMSDGVHYANGDAATHLQSQQQMQTHIPRERLTDIVTADDELIGPLRQIEPWNHWVQAIQNMPIQRPVKIRRGRTFSDSNVEGVYTSSEAKGVKWVSCMIQATGRPQSKRCVSCDKNQGAFENCIIVGGPLFPKCGNCEWNRQGCHGASGETIENVPQGEPSGQDMIDTDEDDGDDYRGHPRRGSRDGPRPSRGDEPWAERLETANQAKQAKRLAKQQAREARINGRRQARERLHGADVDDVEEVHRPAISLSKNSIPVSTLLPAVGERMVVGRPRQGPPADHPHSEMSASALHAQYIARVAGLAGLAQDAMVVDQHKPSAEAPSGMTSIFPRRTYLPRPLSQPEMPGYAVNSAFTPANTRSRPPSHDTSTPVVASAEASPQPADFEIDENLPEITRASLILENDGKIYTWPPSMYGVPLEKIDENHPYWDPSWVSVRSLIEPALQSWKDKHQAAVEAEAEGKKGGSSKYQVGRQVNRGKKILEFLDTGSISPYQLLGKQYVQTGKGGITSYDTLFRLSESLSELEKFNLEVEPVDWIRQRLHELMSEQKDNFNLGRIVHDFYHDPKLTALRYKHGFKNIGRPSGTRWSGHKGHANISPPSMLPSNKRKSMHSLSGTPQGTPPPERSPLVPLMPFPAANRPVEPRASESPSYLTATKRLRPLSPVRQPAAAVPDEPQTGDFSDADSWSGAPIGKLDWRIYQVKTRLYTSSTGVTQYWTWVGKDRSLEHQALKETDPVQWGRHRQPVDFDVKVVDIAEVVYSVDALRVSLVMRRWGAPPAKKDGLPRGDVMASFKRQRTLQRFLDFLKEHRIPLIQESA